MAITVNIIIITAVIISFIFVQIIKDFLITNRTTSIFSLIDQQQKRHIGDTTIFSEWNTESSKQKFQDLTDEVLGSYCNIVAIELHTPEGVLVWTTLKSPTTGTSPEKDEVTETLQNGRTYHNANHSVTNEPVL